MLLHFTKMHGLGNDFVVIDAINQSVDLSTEQLRFIANRRFGVGCDQILLVETPDSDQVDFRYRIFNADGGEVEQCGNGARCFALFVRNKGLTDKNQIAVQTRSGNITLSCEGNNQVTVNMGIPRFEPDEIPFQADHVANEYALDINNQTYSVGVVSIGNPHTVLRVENTESAPVSELGPLIEHHPRFPNRVNAGFMQVINEDEINLRVWERGSGETLACGTGACAAVVSGIQRAWLHSRVVVNLHGGQLIIQWEGVNQPILMTGPAESVFEGTIQL